MKTKTPSAAPARNGHSHGSTAPLFPKRAGQSQVEVIPGHTTVPVPPQSIPRVAIHDVIPTGEAGVYRHQARVHSAQVELSSAMLKKLGLGVHLVGLKRLIKAGFVEGCMVSPNRHIFSIESYYAHCDLVREITERGETFWTPDRLARYRTAL